MLNMIRKLNRWVPADCPGCGKRTPNQNLCAKCTLSLLPKEQKPRCQVCTQSLTAKVCLSCLGKNIYYDKVISAFDYKDLGQQLVHDYKIHKRLAIASLLVDLLVDKILCSDSDDLPDVVIPIPAHTDSVYKRGFSPAAELARLTAKRLKLKYKLDLLSRSHETPKQSTLNYRQRQLAQQNAFSCAFDSLNINKVALVDDVMTTGATLNAAAYILKSQGIRSVNCWVLARALIE